MTPTTKAVLFASPLGAVSAYYFNRSYNKYHHTGYGTGRPVEDDEPDARKGSIAGVGFFTAVYLLRRRFRAESGLGAAPTLPQTNYVPWKG